MLEAYRVIVVVILAFSFGSFCTSLFLSLAQPGQHLVVDTADLVWCGFYFLFCFFFCRLRLSALPRH
jgi:hypothetical protein